jgi:hypothetical protein
MQSLGWEMSVLKSISVEDVLRRGSITDVDVKNLRSAFYHDGEILPQEAEVLFALNDGCASQHPDWAEFFVEAITDFIVNQAVPEGYVTAQNAAWLISRIEKDGCVETKTELELILNVLDKSRWSPASLVSFALNQVKYAVISGSGPLRNGLDLQPGTISEGEVELLRRMVYAFGGDGNVAITRAEAEVFFDINDAVSAAPINPAWTDLFVKVIANVLMASSGYAMPTREEALRAGAWIESRGELAPGALLAAMVRSSLDSVGEAYREQSSEDRALARLERQRIEIITNEAITEGEAGWLAERIGRDGIITPNEQALLNYLREESPEIHPLLNELIDRFATAA